MNAYRISIKNGYLVPMLVACCENIKTKEETWLEWRGEDLRYGQPKETFKSHGVGGVEKPAPMPEEDKAFFHCLLRQWYHGPFAYGEGVVVVDPSRLG